MCGSLESWKPERGVRRVVHLRFMIVAQGTFKPGVRANQFGTRAGCGREASPRTGQHNAADARQRSARRRGRFLGPSRRCRALETTDSRSVLVEAAGRVDDLLTETSGRPFNRLPIAARRSRIGGAGCGGPKSAGGCRAATSAVRRRGDGRRCTDAWPRCKPHSNRHRKPWDDPAVE